MPTYEMLHAVAGATRDKIAGMRMQAQEALLQVRKMQMIAIFCTALPC